MRRVVALLFTTTMGIAACSGSDAAPTTIPASAASETTVASAIAEPTTTESTTTTTTSPTTTEAPPTTIDEAAILAEVEAAYLAAFDVGKEIVRNPGDPGNDALVREHYTGANLQIALDVLQQTLDGNFVAKVNQTNPSLAIVTEPAAFIDGDRTLARLTVCEFNSDRIFEIGTAPGGGDSLRRDDPLSILIVYRMALVEGRWKALEGTLGEEIRDEAEQCSGA